VKKVKIVIKVNLKSHFVVVKGAYLITFVTLESSKRVYLGFQEVSYQVSKLQGKTNNRVRGLRSQEGL
jgi:hypothetical protein